MGIELEADFHLGVALGEKLDAIHSVLNKRDPKPNYLRLSRSGTGTSVVLDFGKPPANRIWNVLSIVSYGTDDHTSVTGGNMAWYVGDNANPPSLISMVDTGLAIPAGRTYSRDIMWCYPNENLIAVLTATGSQQLGANVIVAEWDIKDKW